MALFTTEKREWYLCNRIKCLLSCIFGGFTTNLSVLCRWDNVTVQWLNLTVDDIVKKISKTNKQNKIAQQSPKKQVVYYNNYVEE